MRGYDRRGAEYPPFVAFIFIFNLIVGTGVLALPSVLVRGGWVLGSIFLILVSFLSYVSLTFILEGMATANAVISLQEELLPPGDNRMFQISKRTELGDMAGLFFNHWGRLFFYAALILYLFGDSVIYITLVTRSLTGLVYGEAAPAWAFDTFLCLFIAIMLPFCFFDFQKTQPLQMVTLCIRNAALFTMILLAFKEASKAGYPGKTVPLFNFSALTNLFGGAVYSFMCHHSLPGIITPMRDKAQVLRISTFAFAAVLAMYLLLFLSCGLAFGLSVSDPITFSFPPKVYGIVGDALFLFPVCTLSSTFPMLGITLRNNLDSLFQLMFSKGRGTFSSDGRDPAIREFHQNVVTQSWTARHARIWLTLLAVLPPTFCSLIAEHLQLSVDELVGMTGAFAGSAVMFIIPASMVFYARRTFVRLIEDLSENSDQATQSPMNIHASPFSGDFWVFTLLGWGGVAILFNGYEKLFK